LHLADRSVLEALGAWLPVGVAERPFQFGDKPVRLGDEARAAGMRTRGDHVRCALGEPLPVSHSSPPPDIAKEQQGQATQVVRPARVPKVGEEIFETKPEALGKMRHGAVQHNILA